MESCSSCGDTEVNLYYCNTCAASEKELLCDECVSHHVKRRHDVKTILDHIPEISQLHAKLHSDFCKTCDATFCSKCLTHHTSHEIGDIELRAKEMKTEIFEILNDLQVAEKYLQTRKEKMSEIKSEHDNEQTSIKELIDVKIEQLRAKCKQKIDKNSEKIGTELNERSNDVETVLKLQNDSRSLLSIPSSSLIKSFDSVKSASWDQLQMVEKVKRVKVEVSSCKVTTLAEKFENFEEIMEEMLATNVIVQEFDVGNESEKRCVKDETKKEIQQSEDTPSTDSEAERESFDLETPESSDEDARNAYIANVFAAVGEYMMNDTQDRMSIAERYLKKYQEESVKKGYPNK